jgi:hypothetical protein
MKPKVLAASMMIPVIALASYCVWPTSPTAPQVAPKAAIPPTAVIKAPVAPPAPEKVAPRTVDLALAIEEKSVVAEFTGNNRDKVKVVLLNKGTAPLHVTIPLGQMFESDGNAPVIVLFPAVVDVAPGKTGNEIIRTAATRSTNQVAATPCRLAYATIPKLEPLLLAIQSHPEISITAAQTAVLALTENLPLSAVAKFSLASAGLPSRFNTDAFRTDTIDIIGALTILQEVGVKQSLLTLTVDPQLKIEAMIDPASRPLAMRYYGIGAEREWEFWRNELLNGEPSTRHYALYGIARFYPDVALQMLPRWAVETRTNPIYRLSAVQALADTQRSEALIILRELTIVLGQSTELGKAATGAADYLDYQLAQVAAARGAVAFHTSKKSEVYAGTLQ